MAESLPATRKSVPTEKTYILQDAGNTDTNNTAAVESGTNNKVCNETQVGSPAVRLRLAHCTAWVKRWSEAMDFKLFSKQISPYRESLRIILYHPPSRLLPKAFHHSLT